MKEVQNIRKSFRKALVIAIIAILGIIALTLITRFSHLEDVSNFLAYVLLGLLLVFWLVLVVELFRVSWFLLLSRSKTKFPKWSIIIGLATTLLAFVFMILPIFLSSIFLIRSPLLIAPPGDTPVPPPPPPAFSAFWNTWFENKANNTRVEELELNKTYCFVLDISPFWYFEHYKAKVDPYTTGIISEALQCGDTNIRFIIRPILHGDSLRFDENERSSQALDVNLTRFLKPSNNAVEYKKDQDNLERFLAKATATQIEDSVKDLRAGVVRFNLVAQEAGDARISISIWDSTGRIPLDHLALAVSVKDPSTPQPGPTSASQTRPLKHGRGTLLNVSLDLSSTGPLMADASFYIFEAGQLHGKSTILFAARNKNRNTTPSDVGQDIAVYAWETVGLLSSYIEDPKHGLFPKLLDARLLAEGKHNNPYQDAAASLWKEIFSGYGPKDKKQASGAETFFRDLVQQTGKPPIVFVRMRKMRKNLPDLPVYLPLGILAATSKTSSEKKGILLVQPLPREHYPAGAHPVGTWILGIPKQLKEITDGDKFVKDELSNLQVSLTKSFYRDIPTLKGFFEEVRPSPLPSDAEPEGILILAHQGGGTLYHTEKSGEIRPSNMNRQFASGSVAILSACSVASSAGNNQDILEILNRNNIDAMVISPFPIKPDYGAILAIKFMEALDEAKATPEGLTLAELFNRAADKTTTYFKDPNHGKHNYEQMALEFIIAGDYRIRIAPR